MILVFGTVCLDRVHCVPSYPRPGGYAEISKEVSLLGGEAANTALALAHWSVVPTVFGNGPGIGPDSETLRKLIAGAGFDLIVAEDGDLTPVCDIYVTPNGDRTMFGRGFSTIKQGVDVTKAPYQAGSWFTVDSNMEEIAREAANLARDRGMNVYLMDFIRDTDKITKGSWWQSSTDSVGHRSNTQKNVAWVKEFVAKSGCFAILSDGPNGFVAGSQEVPVRAFPPYPCPEVVDTTGAGDVFRAGMLFGLSQSWLISDCLRFASAAGCLNCRGLGATSKLPTVAEIKALIQDNPDVSRGYDL